MADLEARMSTIEHVVEEQGEAISDIKQDIKCIKEDCISEKVSNAEIKIQLASLINQNANSMKLVWRLFIAFLIFLAAVFGVDATGLLSLVG
jgi:t-SNARE complex subunit (syntaxin)